MVFRRDMAEILLNAAKNITEWYKDTYLTFVYMNMYQDEVSHKSKRNERLYYIHAAWTFGGFDST